jgi:DNA polymerase-1
LTSGKKPELITDNYLEVDNFEMIKGKVISIDFETTSANYHDETCRVLSVSISDEAGKAYTHVFKMSDSKYVIPKGFKRLLGKDFVKVVTARPFDENVCKYLLGLEMKGEIYDTLTMAHVLDENSFPVYNLENIAGYYGGMQRIKDVAEGFRENLANAPREVLVKYNSVDADATIRAYWTMEEKYKGDEKLQRYLHHFIQPVQTMLSDISRYGVLVDQALLDTNERIVQEKVDELVEESKRLLPRGLYKEIADGYSLTKNAMLQQVLFTHPKGFKRKPEMVTPKTHSPQVNEAHLKMFSHIPFVAKVLEWRKHYKILTTYFPMVRDSIKSDGRVYPNVSLVRTATGRSVTLDPGITIIPARGELAKLIKDTFVADSGWLLGARDLSQSEIRIMGWIAGDRNILDAIDKGIDIHTKTASVVNNIPVDQVTKQMRQQAKGINFGFLYGMIAKTFKQYAKESYGLDLTLEECEKMRNAFFAKPNGYYALPAYYQRVEKILKEYGYIRSPLGRKRRLPAIYSDNFAERSEAIRQGINFVIQSFSSDLAFIGMMLFWREYSKSKALKDKVKALWFIHDSIIFTARKEVFDDAMELLKECMEAKSKEYIKEKFGLTVGYKIESDAKHGERWGSLQEYK